MKQSLIADHGSFRAYLASFAVPADALHDLTRRFAFLGESGASRLLMSAARGVQS